MRPISGHLTRLFPTATTKELELTVFGLLDCAIAKTTEAITGVSENGLAARQRSIYGNSEWRKTARGRPEKAVSLSRISDKDFLELVDMVSELDDIPI